MRRFIVTALAAASFYAGAALLVPNACEVVYDTHAPVITAIGSLTVTVAKGGVYVDPGATALDNMDGNVTARITAVSTVNTGAAGAYSVTYSVSDNAGNAALPIVRNVRVAGKPVITVTP